MQIGWGWEGRGGIVHHDNPLITWAHELEKLGACVVCGMQPKRVFGSRGKELTASHLAASTALPRETCSNKYIRLGNIHISNNLP